MDFSASFSVYLLLLLLFHTATTILSKRHCSPSCGNLNISYPFSLKGDPVGCGEPKFELVCEEKHAVLYLNHSRRFFVTEIVNSELGDGTFKLVYTDFMASPGCLLPDLSFLRPLLAGAFDSMLTHQDSMDPFLWNTNNWASFLNCSEEIHSSGYIEVSCLSDKSSKVYVVVNYYSFAISNLKNSCSFLTTIPVGDERLSRGTDVFNLLEKGFQVFWYNRQWKKPIIRYCLQEHWWELFVNKDHTHGYRIIAFITFGTGLLSCIYEESFPDHSHILFSFAIVVILLGYITFFFLVCRIIFVPLLIHAFLTYNCWKNRAPPLDAVEKFLRNQQQSLSPTRYAYSEIITMTCHFSEKLGQGGFGSVFKGKILGRYPVAVKILGNSKFNGDEFINEVSTIGKIHHTNIVQLLGFCSEGSKRALVYEYMPHGSLDKYIFSSNRISNDSLFSFDKLIDIALGVAKGINYLHHGCDMQILHFDIKPHNILLDHNFKPKISDFGLAKLYPKDCSVVSISAARGTIGYIAPELISRSFGTISHKSDVYSFGMLLLEMAGRRRNVDTRAKNSSQIYYPSWIYDRLTQVEVEELGGELVDNVRMEIDEMEKRLSTVGLWCIQMKSCDRPSMSSVMEMLEGNVNNLRLPPKPFSFSSQSSISTTQPRLARSSIGLSIASENDDLLEPM